MLKEASSERRWTARGLEFGGGAGREARSDSRHAHIDILQGNKMKPLLRVGPLRRGCGVAALVVATTGAADDKLPGV